MYKRAKVLIGFVAVTAAVVVLVSCSTGTEVAVPDFSGERMMDTIRYLSAEDGGRIAGFEGEAEAAEYILDELRAMGLEVSREYFPVTAFRSEHVSLAISPDGMAAISEVKALTFSASTPPDGITAEIVPVGLGALEDYKEREVMDKIVLVGRGGELYRDKAERARKNGAAAVIFFDPDGEGAISATLLAPSSIPVISIARKEAELLEKAASEGVSVLGTLSVDCMTRESSSSNVIGLLESRDNPEGKCVIIGAHYDGVDTPAANDNASGVAVLLELAKALTEGDAVLPYDVRFIAFGAEEIGLIGSTSYINGMRPEEIDSIMAVLIFDMVGTGDSFEILSVEGIDTSKLADAVGKTLVQMGHNPIFSYSDRSDHAAFSHARIQAVAIQMSPARHYHTEFDTVDIIDPKNLVEMCRLGTDMLFEEFPQWVNAE